MLIKVKTLTGKEIEIDIEPTDKERREDGGRLQDPGRLRPPSCPGPAGGRGAAVRGRGSRRAPPLSLSPAREGAGGTLPRPPGRAPL
ncbi:uncharacterized protein LOC142074610 isoform X1 [Calonectris borealis]|uniref:ubiquitin-like protein NEDD8 isoform X1 n=1 Tax=Calonectris borealis TaxID=1323832 RepID=UPI003F4C4127